MDAPAVSPSLAALSPLARAFVLAKVQYGSTNAAAAKAAGYTGNAATIRATAYRVAHDPRVQHALWEQCQGRLQRGTAMAIRIIEDIAADESAPLYVRLRAACEILKRSGFLTGSQRTVTVATPSDAKDKLAQVLALASKLGFDKVQTAALLGHVQSGTAEDED